MGFFGFFGISFVDTDEIVQQADVLSSPKRITRRSSSNFSPKKSALDKGCGVSTKVPVSKSSSSAEVKLLSDEEVAELVVSNKLKDHLLEKALGCHDRAVQVRRMAFESKLKNDALKELPHEHSLDYSKVFGANCEIVVGYVPLPVGIVGPCTLNGESVYIPMATTEGCLVASTNRGCKAISQGSGAFSTILRDGITRAPCVRLPSAQEAGEVLLWIEDETNFMRLKEAFESTTSFGKLIDASPTVAGKNVYIRLRCFAGDAM